MITVTNRIFSVYPSHVVNNIEMMSEIFTAETYIQGESEIFRLSGTGNFDSHEKNSRIDLCSLYIHMYMKKIIDFL